MDCELCGVGNAHRIAIIEGVKMIVCDRCVTKGHEVKENPVQTKSGSIVMKRKQMAEDTIVSDYASVVRKARQKRGLEQKDFALKLNEKQSIISKVESGAMTPTIPLAHKIEKLLGVVLVEKTEQAKFESGAEGEGLTLGDVLKIK